MKIIHYGGLGTALRLLLAQLDGELAQIYEAEESEFRPRFYPVFQLLLETGHASVSEIASSLQVSQPAATQTLVEMKRLGFVSYEAGSDRRERIVRLTPHALATAESLRPTWIAIGEAAAQLDRELSAPLSMILDEAIAALTRKSFPDRISQYRRPKEE
ncbi:MAG: hypothetical protein WBA51_11785 [Erythrobacter sp.]